MGGLPAGKANESSVALIIFKSQKHHFSSVLQQQQKFSTSFREYCWKITSLSAFNLQCYGFQRFEVNPQS